MLFWDAVGSTTASLSPAGTGSMRTIVFGLRIVVAAMATGWCAGAWGQAVTPIDWSRFAEPAAFSENALLNREVVQHFDTQLMATEPAFFNARPRTAEGYVDFGGTGEREIRRPAFTAFSVAASVKTGAYNPTIAGASTQQALDFAVDLATSVAAAHRANGSGGFGDHWQSALWTSSAGKAGWLLWDDLGESDRQSVARMVEYEANRFLNATPPYWNGDGGNSRTEENSWDATVLDLAVGMMPTHPNAGGWLTKATQYRLSAAAAPGDADSGELVHGVPLSEWVSGYNINADGSVANHNIEPHPTYATATIKQNTQGAHAFGLAGMATPASVAHNLDLMYQNLAEVEWDSPPFNDPGGTIYRSDGTIYWPDEGENNRRFRYYLFANADAMTGILGAGGLIESDPAHWERLHWLRTRQQQANPDAPGSSDGIAGYNPPHGAATAWLGNYLAAYDAITVSNAPLSQWPVTDTPLPDHSISDVQIAADGTIESITVSGRTILPSEFISVTPTAFTDGNAAQITLEDGGQVPSPNWSVVSDLSLHTGLANFDTLDLQFTSPVVNNPGGPDLVIADVGAPLDAFEITINGVTELVPQNSQHYTTARYDFDLYESTNHGETSNLSDLADEDFVVQSDVAESFRTLTLVELSDFGIAAGEAVSQVSLVNASGEFDLMALIGFVAPDAGPGDYNGDGAVNSADYTVWRDSLGGDATALADGSRDPNQAGPVGAGDFAYWRLHFEAGPAAEAAQIPEPAAAMLIGAIAMLLPSPPRNGRRTRWLWASACPMRDAEMPAGLLNRRRSAARGGSLCRRRSARRLDSAADLPGG